MAKKKPAAKRKTNRQPMLATSLPQNILPMGERVEEDKNIYISQPVYRQIHRFTKNKTTNESGGVLLGTVCTEFGKTNILIQGFIEAKFSEGTPTTLKFTHESWEYIHREQEKNYRDMKILGWIHTHPNFGIFLSEYDKFIHENFFGDENQVAYVVDPIQHEEGFYFWINHKLERCKGFYIFDQNGVKIDIAPDKASAEDATGETGIFGGWSNILLIILAFATFLTLLSNFSLRSKVENLQSQQADLEQTTGNYITYLQQQITALRAQLVSGEAAQSALQAQLEALQIQLDALLNQQEDVPEEEENTESEEVEEDAP